MSERVNVEQPRIPEPVKRRHVINAVDAREQASEQLSFLASEFRRVAASPEHPDGEVFEIPHKDLFDPEQQDRYEEMLDEMRDYDREPDITSSDGVVVTRGELMVPHRRNGKRVKPAWSERLGIVLWGKDGAARFRSGGGNFNEIEIIWAKQSRALRKWRDADSKSIDGDGGVAPASDGDRAGTS